MSKDSIKNSFMNVLTEFEIKFREKSIDKFLKSFYIAKEDINKKLGLNEDNDFRLMFEHELTDDQIISIINKKYDLTDVISDIIKYDLEDNICDYSWNFLENKIKKLGDKQEIKLTKFLNTHKGFVKGRFDINEKRFKEMLTYKSLIHNKKITISTNPYDFLTCSAEGKYTTFTSCMRPGGEYFNGVFAYGLMDNVFISYIEKNEVKNGRSWIIVNDDFSKMYQMASYGTFGAAEKETCRKFVFNLLSENLKIKSDWKSTHLDCLEDKYFSGHCAPIYFDYGKKLIFSFDKERCGNDEEEFKVNLSVSMCLFCGKTTKNTEDGTCEGCQHLIECKHCGELVHEDSTVFIDDERCCQDCMEELYFKCDKCKEYHIKSEQYEINDINEFWCDYCSENYAVKCSVCGDFVDNDYIVTEDTCTPYCLNCTDDVIKCDKCGEFFDSESNKVDDKEYCDSCFSKVVLENTDNLNEEVNLKQVEA